MPQTNTTVKVSGHHCNPNYEWSLIQNLVKNIQKTQTWSHPWLHDMGWGQVFTDILTKETKTYQIKQHRGNTWRDRMGKRIWLVDWRDSRQDDWGNKRQVCSRSNTGSKTSRKPCKKHTKNKTDTHHSFTLSLLEAPYKTEFKQLSFVGIK